MSADIVTAPDMREPSSGAGRHPLLQVRDLVVTFATPTNTVNAVRGISFDVARGEVVGIVGESGSGKSVTATAIMGLHGETARIKGSIRLDGDELVGASDKALGKVRGKRIAMIFQDPMTSLNPVMTVGNQVKEAVLIHRSMSGAEAQAESIRLLELVGIPNAAERAASYPHEFSGGMRQRVVIAIAMANDPDLIIADEPTTALDVTVQAQVLDALEVARKHTNAALILVTHDLGVVAGRADRVMVMYGGRAVETGDVDDLFYRSRMPYTRGLLASIPRLDNRLLPLIPIKGSPPSPASLDGSHCPFAARCEFVTELCTSSEPPLIDVPGAGHRAACHYASDYARVPERNPDLVEAPPRVPGTALAPSDGEPVLSVQHLTKNYSVRSKNKKRTVHAVADVSFDIAPGETLGLVGESGCGKSSVSRSVVRLQDMTGGRVTLNGDDLAAVSGRRLRVMRRRIQMVFQDPYSSLDPRMSVEDILAEPLRLSKYPQADRAARIAELLSAVGLSPTMVTRYPHEFSGGQRQRLGIARALATDPEVLVLDEPVSALDVSVQAGVINLLRNLIRDRQLGALFIAHDLSVVAHISDRIAVMYLGRIVEIGDSEDVFTNPVHPYTKALISAVPLPDPILERTRESIQLHGEVPSPLDPPSGCPFRTRCAIFEQSLTEEQRTRCRGEVPALIPHESRQAAACHFPDLYPVPQPAATRAD